MWKVRSLLKWNAPPNVTGSVALEFGLKSSGQNSSWIRQFGLLLIVIDVIRFILPMDSQENDILNKCAQRESYESQTWSEFSLRSIHYLLKSSEIVLLEERECLYIHIIVLFVNINRQQIRPSRFHLTRNKPNWKWIGSYIEKWSHKWVDLVTHNPFVWPWDSDECPHSRSFKGESRSK
jgi:hypothetical protein